MGVPAIQRILYPTDLPPHLDHGLFYAVTLAQTLGAKLYFFHCTASLRDADASGPCEDIETFQEILRQNIPVAKGGLDWEGILSRGEVGEAISLSAAQHHVDMIVTGIRQGAGNSTMLGTVVESICRTAPCSVLLARPCFPQPDPTSGEIPLRKILVAHDFSSDSELALSYASSLAYKYRTELHLMHVLPAQTGTSGDPSGGAAQNRFQRATNGLRNALLSVGPRSYPIEPVVSTGKPYLEVLTYAEGQEIDLICMGRFGADFQPRSLFGSNVDRVLRQAPCPVLVARPLMPGNSGAASS